MLAGKGYTCSGSEYRGTAAMQGNHSAAGCLAAAQGMADQGVDFALYPGNGNCYVCSITGDVARRRPNQAHCTVVLLCAAPARNVICHRFMLGDSIAALRS